MTENHGLVDRFEAHRDELRAVAYRILGSLGEAEDAVQEAWLRLVRVDVDRVENLGGWLRTVVSRVCIDMLRSMHTRREDLTGNQLPEGNPDFVPRGDPEQEAALVDSVGRALLIVLDRLGPAERAVFVLHDLFAMPFDEIGPIVDRSASTAKKMASRARHKVRGTPSVSGADLLRQRHVIEAFLAASRAGDVQAVLTVLAPDVVRRADPAALTVGRSAEAHGARNVAEEIVLFGRNSRFAEPALVNGVAGIVVAPRGRLTLAITLTIEDQTITEYELIADPARLQRLDVAVLDK